MCSRARLRSVAMSERKAPAISALLGAGRSRRRALAVARVLRFDVGPGALVLRLRFLLAGVLLLAFLGVALLLRDLVLVLGLGLVHIALVARRRLVFLLDLGLGDLLLALGVGLADFLLVAAHGLALGQGFLVVRLHAFLVGVLQLVVDARLVGHAVGAGALRLRGAGEAERERCGDQGEFGLHRWLLSVKAFSAGPRRARPGRGRRTRRTGSWRSRPRRQRCR